MNQKVFVVPTVEESDGLFVLGFFSQNFEFLATHFLCQPKKTYHCPKLIFIFFPCKKDNFTKKRRKNFVENLIILFEANTTA